MVLHCTSMDEVENQIAIEILSQEEEEVHPCWEVLEEQKLTMLHQDPAVENLPLEEIVVMTNLEATWMGAGKDPEEEAEQEVSEVDLLHLTGIVVIAEAATMVAVATTNGLEPTTTLVDLQITAAIAEVDEGDVKSLSLCF